MGFLSRDREEAEERPKASLKLRELEAVGLGGGGYESTLAQQIATRASLLSQEAQADIRAGDGSSEDLASVVESLEGLYAIGSKLHQIDETLLAASAGLLEGYLQGRGVQKGCEDLESYEYHRSDAETFTAVAASQAARLKSWAAALERPAKQQWFNGLLAVRDQVLDSYLGAFGHVQELRRDMAFIHTAVRAQNLLPEFSIADARADLLTTEGEARKARELADHAATIDPPRLDSLEAAAGTPEPDERLAEPVEIAV